MKGQGLFSLRDPISVEDWLSRWLDGPGRTMTGRVLDERRKLINRWVLPAFGARMLNDVGSNDIAGLIESWRAAGAMPNTIRQRFFALNGMFSDARRERMMWRNPCAGVVVPRREHSAFQWTAELLRTQFACLKDGRCFDLGRLVMGSALRPIELYYTEVDDYDRQMRTLRVRYPGRYVILPRTICLPSFAAEAVERMLEAATRKDTRFLWSMADGRRCTRAHFNQVWRDAYAALAPAPPTVHCSDLRLAFAFLGERAGIDPPVIAYYMKMRPAAPAPSPAELQSCAEAIDSSMRAVCAIDSLGG